jgi:hypothetical protein
LPPSLIHSFNQETSALKAEFEQISTRYDSALNESQSINKKLKDKEKMVEFLEKEITKRNAEFQSMVRVSERIRKLMVLCIILTIFFKKKTKTFEEFLSSRARQARQERVKRLMKMRGKPL